MLCARPTIMYLYATENLAISEVAMTLSQQIDIINKLGLHARAASKLVKLASKFDSELTIEKDEQSVSCKSIMGVMMLAASCGSKVTLHANGEDAEQAMDAITALINRRFDEDE